MNYILHTRDRGLCLRTTIMIWDLKIEFFYILGRADSNYATNIETRKSISSLVITLNGVLVVMRSVS